MVTDLTLNFLVGHHEDSGPGLHVLNANNTVFQSLSVMSRALTINCKINLPGIIEFVITGKSDSDTVVDHCGNIVKDKFIHFDSMTIGGINIDSWQIPPSCLVVQSSSDITKNFFWNKNGSVKLIFDQDDPLIWILTHKTLVGIVE